MEQIARIAEHVVLDGIDQAVPVEVAFRDFASLAQRRDWTPQFLAERFRGAIEEPTELFTRILSGKTPDTVIPYASVLAFYQAEISPILADGGIRLCACGCGSRVYGRKQYAKAACRQRSQRDKTRKGSRTPKNGT